MLTLKRLAWLKAGAPPRNVVEAALSARLGGGGASYEKTVGPSAILSVTDAKRKPALSLIAGMEPVQDLHGYSNPWPAGGGKNLLPSPTSIDPASSTTITNNNGLLTITSTGAGQSKINIPSFTFAASGQKIELLNSFTSGTVRFYNGDTQIDYFSLNTANRVISASSLSLLQGQTIDNYRVQLNGATSGTLGIMITPDADAALSAFSPYENICPISGRTGVTVTRTGRNLLNTVGTDTTNGYVSGKYLSNVGAEVGGYSGYITEYTPIAPSTGYIYSGFYGSAPSICFYDSSKNFISSVQYAGQPSKTFTTPSTAAYYRASVHSTEMTQAQLEIGSTASAYEPYTGTSYPVSWQSEAGTVYGGTVDIVSGVLTVTHAFWSKNTSTMNNDNNFPGWKNSGIKALVGPNLNKKYTNVILNVGTVFSVNTTSGVDIIYLPIADYNNRNQDAWIALAQDVQIVVPLAEPQTYQLDPQTVQMLKGENNLWNDAGDSTLTYVGTEPGE